MTVPTGTVIHLLTALARFGGLPGSLIGLTRVDIHRLTFRVKLSEPTLPVDRLTFTSKVPGILVA